MTLLSVNSLTVTQPTKTLFEGATFGIAAHDKVAVIGPNGCGKSTLLKMVATIAEQPNPAIVSQRGLRTTYLSQQFDFEPEHAIKDHIYNSDNEAAKAIKNYHHCADLLNQNSNEKADESSNVEIETKFSLATDAMERTGAWAYEDRVNSILRELNITDLSQKMGQLSGGMLKKIAFAKLFFEETDLLILDEPTNHLDLATIEWLEEMLEKQRSAILMVTHDRYFLDKICTHILEIDQKKVYSYKGNYLTYLEQREQRYHDQSKRESSIRSALRVELAWLSRGPRGRGTKQKARKDRIDTIQNRERAAQQANLELSINEQRLGKKILAVKDISKSFTTNDITNTVIESFSYTFKHRERLGVLGPNGAGKTTLLNLIMTQLKPDKGDVDVGVNTVFGYFDQHSQNFDLDKTIFEHVSEIGSQIRLSDGAYVSASKFLEKFLFPSQMLGTQIGRLSGGERRRLHLVCLLLKNPNFLIFDEPTNDLDIQTLSVLEEFLLNFDGCLIVISHDRYFMDRVVDRMLVFDGKGSIKPFIGNYSEYVAETLSKNSVQEDSVPKVNKKHITEDAEKRAQEKKVKKEISILEKDIDVLEDSKKDIHNYFLKADSSDSDYQAMCKKLNQIEDDIQEKTERWEQLYTTL